MATERLTFRPESCRVLAAEAGRALAEQRIVARIRQKDHTVWKPDPAEIADRLGWLASPQAMPARLAEIGNVVDAIRADGYDFALLLGMGGSSLAPEVFRKVFGRGKGFLDLAVLDSTDPGAVLAWAEGLDLKKTLFVVSTKSGGTVETFSFLRYFYRLTAERLGAAAAGSHFIAITDPGSALAEVAKAQGFRHCFLNDPEIGGRYSALSCFGLFPAALIGIDAARLLAGAAEASDRERTAENEEGWMSGALLGALLGELARQGRDKLTFCFSPSLAPFGDWLEQLLAESTGKEGTGILPVTGEPLGPPAAYDNDRLFVSLRLGQDRTGERELSALAAAGHPVCDLRIDELYELGGECFFWEMATAVAGWRLKINPFDQPDVEAAKVLARQMIGDFREKGGLPTETPCLQTPGISLYGESLAGNLDEALVAFFGQARPGAYAALQAYLHPAPETGAALQRLRLRICARFRLASTVGYGPRFLHSTGQLHKGDAGKGLFLQFTADDPRDAPIPDALGRPDATLTFGQLKTAQAEGDRRALLNAGRRVLRVHLHGDPVGGLAHLANIL